MESQKEIKYQEAHLIKEFYVENLFSTYTYRLDATQGRIDESDNIMLLYGNNGSGKTTILNIIYHLLNPEPFGGHRGFIGKIPFRRVEVLLSSNYKICAVRKELDTGPYTILFYDDKQTRQLRWTWTPDMKPDNMKDESVYEELCQKLKELNIKFHYLRDTRRVEGISDGIRSRGHRVVRTYTTYDSDEYPNSSDEEEDHSFQSENLKRTIGRAVDWFRKQALNGTNIGSTSVNSIYKDLIQNIVTQGKSSNEAEAISIDDIKDKLISLNERNKNFAWLGLTAEMDIDDIIENLNSAGGLHSNLLKTVLGPYLDGHKARLDALEEVQQAMYNFISLLGDFYSDKKVFIHLRDGLEIISKRGDVLSPAVLSSGEKQLLLLLCNAISARGRGTIFVIDEPEISLNVKWQRQFIPALLTCLSGAESQIILATHSIELLSRYKDHVTPLNDLAIEA
jgi:predicted ATPase